MSADEFKYYLVGPGPRPPFYRIPQHLWGKDCNFDSDGDSYPDPHTTQWTWLYAALRPDCKEVLNVNAIETAPRLVLAISSNSEQLAQRAAMFLRDEAGGVLKDEWPPSN